MTILLIPARSRSVWAWILAGLLVGPVAWRADLNRAQGAEESERGARATRAAELVESLGQAEPRRAWWVLDSRGEVKESREVAALRAELKTLGAEVAVPALTKALDSDDPRVRGRAALTLAEFGPDAREAIPRLIELLAGETDYTPELVAGRALTRLGAVAAPALREAVKHASPRAHWRAVLALGAIRPVEPESAAVLVEALRDSDESTRTSASRMLSKMGEPVVAPLVALLESDTRHECTGACEVAWRLGPLARSALPILRTKTQVLGTYGEYATYAVLAIDVETACRQAATVDSELCGRARWILSQAHWTKGCTDAEADKALDTLRELIRHEDAGVRERAALGLRSTARWANRSVPLLIERLRDSNETNRVRLAAIHALETLGESGHAALPELRRVAASGADEVATAAAQALERLEIPRDGRK